MKNIYTLDYIIEQIKEKIDVREVAEEQLTLTKKGMAHCPFHLDRTPSFSVSSKKKMFKCFSCDISGDVIDLYAALNHVSNGKAISHLGKRLGLSGSKPLSEPIQRQYAKKKKDRELEQRFLQSYKQIFDELCSIRNTMNDLARKYEFIEVIELDDLLVQYYHQRAYHEDLLDRLLEGLLEEISFEQQIDIFSIAKEVVEKWEKRLYSRINCVKMDLVKDISE